MFIIDVSSSMGTIRAVEVETEDGQVQEVEMTNLAWSLQYVKLKIQEMVCNMCHINFCFIYPRSIIRFSTAGKRTSVVLSYSALKVSRNP